VRPPLGGNRSRRPGVRPGVNRPRSGGRPFLPPDVRSSGRPRWPPAARSPPAAPWPARRRPVQIPSPSCPRPRLKIRLCKETGVGIRALVLCRPRARLVLGSHHRHRTCSSVKCGGPRPLPGAPEIRTSSPNLSAFPRNRLATARRRIGRTPRCCRRDRWRWP
jgi:hypothetical protein